MGKKWVYLGVFVAALLVVGYLYRKYRVAPQIDLAALQLTNLKGEAVSFSAWDGRKKVVCFGASWCPGCRHELADLHQVRNELEGVEVLVISDEPLEKVIAFAEKTGYAFTFLKMTPGFADLGIHSIPLSLIVNSRQEITRETFGAVDWKDPSTRAHLKALME